MNPYLINRDQFYDRQHFLCVILDLTSQVARYQVFCFLDLRTFLRIHNIILLYYNDSGPESLTQYQKFIKQRTSFIHLQRFV